MIAAESPLQNNTVHMITKVKEFTVVRSKWYRGRRRGSRLLNETGQRCCVGFLAKAMGISDADCLDVALLGSYLHGEELKDCPVLMEVADDIDKSGIYSINDCPIGTTFIGLSGPRMVLSAGDREEKLTVAFASIGIKVNFVG